MMLMVETDGNYLHSLRHFVQGIIDLFSEGKVVIIQITTEFYFEISIFFLSKEATLGQVRLVS